MTKQQKCPSSCSGSGLVGLGVLCVQVLCSHSLFPAPLQKLYWLPLLLCGWSYVLGWLGCGVDVGLMVEIVRLELVCIWWWGGG